MHITLEDSITFVRWLETQLIPHKAHCALAGSVLHRGSSEKDLDVIVYPRNQRTPRTPEELVTVLEALFPNGKVESDTSYPHDRFLFRINGYGEGKWRIELFVFLLSEA